MVSDKHSSERSWANTAVEFIWIHPPNRSFHSPAPWSWWTPSIGDAPRQTPRSNPSQHFRWSCKRARLRGRAQTAALETRASAQNRKLYRKLLSSEITFFFCFVSPVWMWYLRSGVVQLGDTDRKRWATFCSALATDMAVYTTGPDTARNDISGGGATTFQTKQDYTIQTNHSQLFIHSGLHYKNSWDQAGLGGKIWLSL